MFTIPAVSMFNVVPDSVHLVDLGVAHHVIGNVLYHICYDAGYIAAAGPAVKLEALWNRVIVQYYRRNTPT